MDTSSNYGLPEASAITTPTAPALPRPPTLQLSSYYPFWKERIQAFLTFCPPAHHFLHVLSSLSDDAFALADAAGFSRTKSMTENWQILDNCFDLQLGSYHAFLKFFSRRQLPGESRLEVDDNADPNHRDTAASASSSFCPIPTASTAAALGTVPRNSTRFQRRPDVDTTRSHCYYCRRYGRKARKCGHNRPRENKTNVSINSLEQEEERLARLDLSDD
ncbi:unnamed protein product [Trichobilharzia szidati]|nr:unnamed protein product [Trichobilharzia szidati]